jgi:hypothetical protein
MEMMSGIGPCSGGWDLIGSVGSAAQMGGGTVLYDTGRSFLAARRMVGARYGVSVSITIYPSQWHKLTC